MSSGLIFLGGGGDIEASRRLDEKFFGLIPVSGKILYIPVALAKEKIDRTDKKNCTQWFSELLAAHDRGRKLTFHLLREDAPIPPFDGFSAIYIGGGNTFKLLDYIHRHNLGASFREFLRAGHSIYGGSAGAIIFGKDISAADSERESYTRADGLSFLGGVSIDCHYEPSAELDAKLAALSVKLGGPILAIPENAGIIYTSHGQLSAIVGDVTRFENSQKSTLY